MGVVWSFFALEGKDYKFWLEKLTSMIFIKERPLTDYNKKALNKMSIIAEVKVTIEEAI